MHIKESDEYLEFLVRVDADLTKFSRKLSRFTRCSRCLPIWNDNRHASKG